jgi:hypothetical protein
VSKRSDTEPQTEKDKLAAHRRRFREKEDKKTEKYEKEAARKQERQVEREERQRRKSEASERRPGSSHGRKIGKRVQENRPGSREPANVTALPNREYSEKGPTVQQDSSEKGSGWQKFVKMMSCGG